MVQCKHLTSMSMQKRNCAYQLARYALGDSHPQGPEFIQDEIERRSSCK